LCLKFYRLLPPPRNFRSPFPFFFLKLTDASVYAPRCSNVEVMLLFPPLLWRLKTFFYSYCFFVWRALPFSRVYALLSFAVSPGPSSPASSMASSSGFQFYCLLAPLRPSHKTYFSVLQTPSPLRDVYFCPFSPNFSSPWTSSYHMSCRNPLFPLICKDCFPSPFHSLQPPPFFICSPPPVGPLREFYFSSPAPPTPCSVHPVSFIGFPPFPPHRPSPVRDVGFSLPFDDPSPPLFF